MGKGQRFLKDAPDTYQGLKMKKGILAILLFNLFLSTIIVAQDTIITNDNTKIIAKVLEVSQNTVKYNKFNNNEGPTYIINVSEIREIIYKNGEKDIFYTKNNNNAKNDNDNIQNNKIERPFIKGLRFNCYVENGFFKNVHASYTATDPIIGAYNPDICLDYGVTTQFTPGLRIYDYAFVGIGFCFLTSIEEPLIASSLSIKGRGYYPINRKTSPFIEMSFGWSHIFDNPTFLQNNNYMTSSLAFGFELSHFTISTGVMWNLLDHKVKNINLYRYTDESYHKTPKESEFAIVLNLGVKIGKTH